MVAAYTLKHFGSGHDVRRPIFVANKANPQGGSCLSSAERGSHDGADLLRVGPIVPFWLLTWRECEASWPFGRVPS